MSIAIEPMQAGDWADVSGIYEEGIATGHATFEGEVPSWDSWNREHLQDCRLVARSKDRVIGWAALSPVSGRCVYRGVAEVSLYVGESARRRGVGKALLRALVSASEQCGLWTLEAGIFPENAASIALHRGCEFREVGRRERLGRMNGVWRDVVLMERRSRSVGS